MIRHNGRCAVKQSLLATQTFSEVQVDLQGSLALGCVVKAVCIHLQQLEK